jgi:hypothetical protein
VDAGLQGCRTYRGRLAWRRPQVPVAKAPRGATPNSMISRLSAQLKRLGTERSSLIRVIASAISGAMVNWRTLRDTRTASVAWMLSVVTSISSGEADTRATAPPDRTPWVT